MSQVVCRCVFVCMCVTLSPIGHHLTNSEARGALAVFQLDLKCLDATVSKSIPFVQRSPQAAHSQGQSMQADRSSFESCWR